MTNAALEMERSYRQYCVLDDPTLAKVYQSQRKRYSEMLDAHAGVLPDDKLYQALRQDLNGLAQLQCRNSGPDTAAAARLEALPTPIPTWCKRRVPWFFTRAAVTAGDRRTRAVLRLAGAGAVSGESGDGTAVHANDYRAGKGHRTDD